MGLLEKAYETYQNHKSLVGRIQEGQSPLLPVAHMILNVQLEITINNKGEFRGVEKVNKEDAETIVPVTIKSAGRSGKDPVAHPLCDKISYLEKGDTREFKDYFKQLNDWANSQYATDKLKAIRNYIDSGTLLCDLRNAGITYDAVKNNIVRWRVIGGNDSDRDACWQNLAMFKSWQNYYSDIISGDEDLCMLSGQNAVISESQPKGVVASSFSAKLISTNDKTNFTFRGRFLESKEAVTVGYIASQCAHNALIWLTRNQGVQFAGRTFICWNPKGFKVPCVWDKLFSSNGEELQITPTDYKQKLYEALTGFKNNLPDKEDVVIAAFDAATTGRLSLTYYCELKSSDFMKRLEAWYLSCNWLNGKFGLQSPNITDIIRFAFGEPRGDNYPDIKDGVYREQFQRILKCVSEKAAIPADLLRRLVNNTSRPQSYKNSHSNVYRKLMFITCALVRKYHNDKLKREEWTLDLEPEKRDRSYQFGRLLAVMEKVETDTYGIEETREANAIRLQSAFYDRPWHYTNIIHQKLNPYFAKLKPGTRRYFKKLIGQIMGEIANFPEQELNNKLADTYLLGYYLQRNEMYKKHEDKQEENESEE